MTVFSHGIICGISFHSKEAFCRGISLIAQNSKLSRGISLIAQNSKLRNIRLTAIKSLYSIFGTRFVFFLNPWRFLLSSALQYRIAQMYMVTKMQEQQTSGSEGVEVLVNEPFENEQFGKGQYTSKIYHLQR